MAGASGIFWFDQGKVRHPAATGTAARGVSVFPGGRHDSKPTAVDRGNRRLKGVIGLKILYIVTYMLLYIRR